MSATEQNWAHNLTYSSPIEHPSTLDEVQELVGRADRVHAIGTRHSFSACADSDGVIVALDGLQHELQIDAAAGVASVGSAMRLGDLGRELHVRGFAIANMPSLPHISLGGAISTATHGSGDSLGMLASLVRGIDVVGADGELRRYEGDALAGAALSYGALGVVVRVTIAVEPAFDITQDSFAGIRWGTAHEHLDEIFSSGYSVSLFTKWTGDVKNALVKSRTAGGRRVFFGAPIEAVQPAEIGVETKHTPQGAPGPSWDRLPHFRLASVPSVGEELQSEYFVPRTQAREALETLRSIGADLDEALHMTELRTVANDELWLSPAFGTDVLAIGFTWKDAPDLVLPLLPRIEERLLPLGGRPHLAKLFAANSATLAASFPRLDDFVALREAADPKHVFGNAFLTGVLGA